MYVSHHSRWRPAHPASPTPGILVRLWICFTLLSSPTPPQFLIPSTMLSGNQGLLPAKCSISFIFFLFFNFLYFVNVFSTLWIRSDSPPTLQDPAFLRPLKWWLSYLPQFSCLRAWRRGKLDFFLSPCGCILFISFPCSLKTHFVFPSWNHTTLYFSLLLLSMYSWVTSLFFKNFSSNAVLVLILSEFKIHIDDPINTLVSLFLELFQ